MTTEIKILQRARELVNESWCQLRSAKNSAGTSCQPEDPAARSWCLTGACRKAAHEEFGDSPEKHSFAKSVCFSLENQLGAQLLDAGKNKEGVVDWQDSGGRTKKEVVDLIDATIKELQK